MGMQLTLKAVTLEEIRELELSHAAVESAIGLGDMMALDLQDPDAIMEWACERSSGNGEVLDLDKAWHVIHFLLTGVAEGGEKPNCYLLAGGTEVGEPLDFGPARVLSPAEVADFTKLLSGRPSISWRGGFSTDRMRKADIYPVAMASPPATDDAEFEYFSEHYENLRRFAAKVAAAGKGMLIWLG